MFVIIVGAGPAGSSATYILSSAGMQVALLDKEVFPRDKLCGGLLSGRAIKIFKDIFNEDWKPIIDYVAYGVEFYYKEQFLNKIDNYNPIYFVQRKIFDSYLVKLAERNGVEFYQETPVFSLNEGESNIIINGGRKLYGDFIIGADGVNSKISSVLFPNFFDKNKLAIGMEINVIKEKIKRKIVLPEIYFGTVRWGYGWIFPKKDVITLGVGGLLAKNQNMKLLFLNFINQICGEIPDVQLRGHYIPFGNYKNVPGKNNILLTGDAAGLVDPITGEGIALAMLSGKLAAESVLNAAKLGKPENALELYKERYKIITKQLDQANLMRHLMFSKLSEKFFVKMVSRSEGLIKNHMDLLDDRIDYKNYGNIVFKKAVSSFFKIF
ncbi:MAG: NAD(P)/FAD-dependent oxidoreductase [bacterium]